jgi:hypothetical protein
LPSALFRKLNFKDQREVLVLNAPASFEAELALLTGVMIHRSPAESGPVPFAIAFAVTNSDLDAASRVLVTKANGDALLWMAYPKGTSKKLKGEFNRTSPFTILRDAGFDTVRQVAIDEDWSALRFRRQV